jgi:uncharacterized protein YfbU (UPF0304 family)
LEDGIVVTISFRIEDDIKERLDRLAEDRGLNVSHIFRQALIDKIREIEPQGEADNRLPLTVKERLFLVLQLRILQAVCPEEKDILDRRIVMLQSGYELDYPDLISLFDNGLSRRACIEVIDILEMHSELFWSLQKLKSKSGIKESDIWFRGFDGNNELRQKNYTEYFLFTLGRYQSLHTQVKKNDCDSHWPMLDTYRNMLRIFNSRKHPSSPLSAEDMKAILAAK